MSPAMRSLQVWSGYVFVMGALLLATPDLVVRLLGIAESADVWARVVGVVAIALGILYASVVRRRDEGGLRATVHARWFVAAAMLLLAFTVGPWQLSLIAAADLAGGTWTYMASRSPADQTS